MEQKFVIILAVKNGIRTIKKFLDCLKSAIQSYGDGVVFIAVDNFSDDGTLEALKSFDPQQSKASVLVLQAGPERSEQRNIAIKKASELVSQDSTVLILDHDQYVEEPLISEACNLMLDESVGSLYIPEETIALGYFGRVKKFERDFYRIGDISAEATRVFRLKDLALLGGYDHRKIGAEDWDLTDRIFKLNQNAKRTNARIFHDEGKISLYQQVKKKQKYSSFGASQYLSDPNTPSYRKLNFLCRPSVKKQWWKLFLRPDLTLGLVLLKFFEGMTIKNWWKFLLPLNSSRLSDEKNNYT